MLYGVFFECMLPKDLGTSANDEPFVSRKSRKHPFPSKKIEKIMLDFLFSIFSMIVWSIFS